MMKSEPCETVKSIPLSPRRKRLRRTAWILFACAAAGMVIGAVFYLKFKPRGYRPGESSADLISSLSTDLPAGAPKPVLTDVTRQVGLGSFRTFSGERSSQLPEDMGAGVAWGDFDNDGFEDVFLVSAGGSLEKPAGELAACALYRNGGGARFELVGGFPELRIHGIGAAWGDYDGDGFLDLVVTGYDTLQLFHNEGGTGRFTREAQFPERKGFWAGPAWGDFDNDRRPDLYVCGYVQYKSEPGARGLVSQQLNTAVPFTLNPASYKAGTNLLFHNNGGGQFTEVGAELGVENPAGRSLTALWHDFDDDGWVDLYVANDVSDNVFYHNEGGRFRDISHAAWVADYRSAMGLAAGDFDRDGDDDLFITHWVAQENALYECLRTATSLRFSDIADMKGVGQMALPFVGWGTEFVDVDSDGWLDLVVANGSTLEVAGPAPRALQRQRLFLLWNRRGEMFHDLSTAAQGEHVSRGLAVSDYDNDGDMDVLVSDLGEGVRLLRNDMQQGRWMKLRLRSRTADGRPAGFADHARVIAHAGSAMIRRTVGGASYCSQSAWTLHFGLGASEKVDVLEVRWHSGATNWWTNVAAGAVYTIVEGDPVLHRESDQTLLRQGFEGQARVLADGHRGQMTGSREQTLNFWRTQRAAMDALKVETNYVKASRLFREALTAKPDHEDSRYYLAHCLAALGNPEGALEQLSALMELNPQSHRAHQQWGTLRAIFSRSGADLDAAEAALERAHGLNPEETGALLVLGEISTMRGDLTLAEKRLAAACRTNPRATGGFFLRAYVAWKKGEAARAGELLREARRTLGADWQPRGATSEGDAARKQFVETTPLTRFWSEWDGRDNPDKAFLNLERSLMEGRGEK